MREPDVPSTPADVAAVVAVAPGLPTIDPPASAFGSLEIDSALAASGDAKAPGVVLVGPVT